MKSVRGFDQWACCLIRLPVGRSARLLSVHRPSVPIILDGERIRLVYPKKDGLRLPVAGQETRMAQHETVTTDHVEYASNNPAVTRKFLEKVLGFHFDVMEAMGGYGMRNDKVARGSGTGVRGLEKGESPATIAYLTVMNLEESLKAAQKEGARVIVPKTEIPEMGWSAVVHAPGDVPIGLFQPKPGAPGM
jgi:uncharacterized protein